MSSREASMPIADAIRTITPADLTEVLRDRELLDGEVLRIGLDELEVGSAVSDLARLSVEYAGPRPGPATMIAKVRGESEGKRALEDVLHFFERECWFFREVAPGLPVTSPDTYHAGERIPVLRLEDLAEHRSCDQIAGLGISDAELVIDDLAALHAMYWRDPALQGFEPLIRFVDPAWAGGLGAAVKSGAPGLARYADRVGSDTVAAATVVAEAFDEVLPTFATDPCTLVHNDCRADNLFFAGEAPIWIDWQGAAVARGVHDVAYLIAGSLELADAHDHWERLLRRYHRGLRAHGVPYDWDDCVAHYRHSVLYALAPCLSLLGALAITSEGGAALTDAMVTRTLAHAVDVGAFATIEGLL